MSNDCPLLRKSRTPALCLALLLPVGGVVCAGWAADGEATTFDFREKAPLASTKTMYLDEDGNVRDNANHDGILAVGVPGTVAGLELAHRRLGSLPWEDLLQPAIDLARDGMPISWYLHDSFKRLNHTQVIYGEEKMEHLPRPTQIQI